MAKWVLAKLPPGTRLRQVSAEGEWVQVEVVSTGQRGYVAAKFVAAE